MTLMNEPIKRAEIKPKYCRFKKNGIKYIDYKDPDFLLKFINEQGKIQPRRLTGTSLKFQKKVAQAVKRARHLAIRTDLDLEGGLPGRRDLLVDQARGEPQGVLRVSVPVSIAEQELAQILPAQHFSTQHSFRSGEKVDQVVSCYVKHDASQCGFCTPGFVVATRAIFNAKPNASLADVHKGLGGNICRCGTYEGISKCALEIAKGGA